jgi:hypothetical protein
MKKPPQRAGCVETGGSLEPSPMKLISGYPADVVERYYLDALDQFTPEAVQRRLDTLDRKIALAISNGQVAGFSLGENCGPTVKLREMGQATLGASFFDGVVLRYDAAIRLITSEFSNILLLKNLEIGRWDEMDSVYDREHGIFYHHFFLFRGLEALEKRRETGLRRIDQTDIALLLPAVRSQFEYLAEKFLRTARSPIRKIYVWRSVEGAPLAHYAYRDLVNSLTLIGARNFELIVIHSSYQPSPTVRAKHYLIPESIPDQRWGDVKLWQDALKSVVENA